MEPEMDLTMFAATDGSQHNNVQRGGSNHRMYNADHIVINESARPKTPPSPCSTVPFSPDPDFVPRPDLVKQIDEKASVEGARVAIVGLGGSGKTQLAIEYARQVRQRSPDTWVLWIHAATAARFKQSVQSIAERAQIDGWRDPNADILATFGRWLGNSKRGQWLLVLDNVDDAKVLVTPAEGTQGAGKRLIDYLPVCDHGSMIITSRHQLEAEQIVYTGNIVSMGPPSQAHSVAILEKKLGRDTEDLYSQLASALDSLPLAVAQAAAYIKDGQPRESVGSFLEELESRARRMSLLSRDRKQPGRDWEASNSILITLQISFDHLRTTYQSAADLLSIMSFCDRQAIPEILIGRGAHDGYTNHNFKADIVILRKFSLISTTTDPDSWEMHRLVQDATQLWLTDRSKLEMAQDRFLKLLRDAFPNDEHSPTCQLLYPHVSVTMSRIPTNNGALLDWSQVMLDAGWYLHGLYRDAETIDMASAARDAIRTTFGEEHDLAMWITELLATGLMLSGRPEEAESLQKELVTVSTKAKGPRDPDTLTFMIRLAENYQIQDKLTDAENLLTQILVAKKEIFGPHHANTVFSMFNLGKVYSRQKRWQDAETILVQALEASKISSGPDAHSTLMVCRELADVYKNSDEGRLEEAEALMVDLLHRREKLLGPDHPVTLFTNDGLATIYRKQRRTDEAIDLQEKLLVQAKKSLGPDRLETMTFMSNLSLIYWDAGRLDEVEELLAFVVERSVEIFGEENATTQKRIRRLGELRAEIAESANASQHTSNGQKTASPTPRRSTRIPQPARAPTPRKKRKR